MKNYVQLTKAQRMRIARLHGSRVTISEIARRIGVHKSTISRELKRNGEKSVSDNCWYKDLAVVYDDPFMLKKASRMPDRELIFSYQTKYAQRKADQRRYWSNQCRTRKHKKTVRSWVIDRLRAGWTPPQIAGRSLFEAPEKICHEAVYQIIHRDKKSGGDLYRLLPRFRKRKQRFNKRDYRDIIPARVDIKERPKIVDERSRLGDLEADLLAGYKSDGYVLVVVDRCSRQVVLEKLQRKTKAEVLMALCRALKSFLEVHTLTVDNGREFCAHLEFTRATGVPVYFATPYSSQERGSVENMNGLIRRYLPKKTPFKNVSFLRLNKIQKQLNERPREVLGYLTPNEVSTYLSG